MKDLNPRGRKRNLFEFFELPIKGMPGVMTFVSQRYNQFGYDWNINLKEGKFIDTLLPGMEYISRGWSDIKTVEDGYRTDRDGGKHKLHYILCRRPDGKKHAFFGTYTLEQTVKKWKKIQETSSFDPKELSWPHHWDSWSYLQELPAPDEQIYRVEEMFHALGTEPTKYIEKQHLLFEGVYAPNHEWLQWKKHLDIIYRKWWCLHWASIDVDKLWKLDRYHHGEPSQCFYCKAMRPCTGHGDDAEYDEWGNVYYPNRKDWCHTITAKRHGVIYPPWEDDFDNPDRCDYNMDSCRV